MSAASSSAPFIQLVSFAAKDEEARKKFLSIWLPAFDYVKSQEIGSLTSTYEAFIPSVPVGSTQFESSQEVIAWETYSSEVEFQRIHMGSEIVKKFLKEVDEAQVLARPTTLNFLKATKLGFFTRGEDVEKKIKESGKKPYNLLVYANFNDQEGVEKFLSAFATLATYVTESEPNTLTYDAFRSSSNPFQIVIFERYVSEADLRANHLESATYKSFLATVGSLAVVKDLTMKSYEEQQLGHWGKE